MDLGIDDDVDTLGRWMSHFLAERLAAAEEARDVASKSRLQKECCTIILQLWERRASLPSRVRPLGSLSEVLHAIVDLRGNKSPYYGATLRHTETGENPWLVFAKGVETGALDLVRLSIFQAMVESVFPAEADKAEKFREFLSEKEVRIVEELQRLIDETGRTTFGSSPGGDVEVDAKLRSRKVLDAIEARLEQLAQSFKQLRQVVLTEQANESRE